MAGIAACLTQCGAIGCATRAIASGPKAGTTMTNTRSLAIQRCIVREYQYPVPSIQYSPIGPETQRVWWILGIRYWVYYFPVHGLAQRLLKTIRKQDLIKAGDRLAVAVSGGADSVALLLLLLDLRVELGIVLSVAHVNHNLRGLESDQDEQFVTELARRHGLEFHMRDAPLAQRDSGIEAAARKLRYDFFLELTCDRRVSKIATAHTLDDQAETVLLRILRGTGIRGLSGIHPRIVFAGQGEVVRPLLGLRRSDLEAFLAAKAQPWREDSSNRDLAFLRNRVRHRLLPLLKEDFGAAALENLADLAEIARAEEEQWVRIEHDPRAFGGALADGSSSLPLKPGLLSLPLAARRRLVRTWLESTAAGIGMSFRLIEEVLDLARGPAGKKLELPGGVWLRRTQRELRLEPAPQVDPADYEYRLSIPGVVDVLELGIRLEAILVPVERAVVAPEERDSLLDPAHLPRELVVRNWRPGDRFWPAHTKEEKKVKELLADRHMTGPQKKLWPVIVAKGCGLVWVRGFPAPAGLHPETGESAALWIRAANL